MSRVTARMTVATVGLVLIFVLPTPIGSGHLGPSAIPSAPLAKSRGPAPASASIAPTITPNPYVWVERPTPASLLQRGQPPMAYDPQLGGIFMFGGYSSAFNNAYDDTWLFKNNTWTNLNATGNLTVSPPGVWWQSLVWDPAGPYILMFGGRNNSLNYVSSGVTDETWIFNTTGWHELFPTTSPSGRAWSAMFYDPVEQKVVLFGGACYYCSAQNQTWFFSNGTWANVSSS